MFLAAFTSRSWTVPQAAHCQVRTCSGFGLRGDHADVCAGFGAELAGFNGEANHVHPLVNFPPTIATSRLVNSMKGVSPRRLWQESPDSHRTTGGHP